MWNPALDEERFQRMVAAQMRSGMAPGMGTSGFAPARDFSAEAASTAGQEAQLAQQQEYINSLRGRKGPEGRTAGQLYMAASPLEHLSSALDKGIAAYGQTKLGDQYREIDEARTAANVAKLEREQGNLDRTYDLEVQEEAGRGDRHDQTMAARAAEEAGRDTRHGITTKATRAEREAARAEGRAKRTRVPFHDPEKPNDPNAVINLERDEFGNWFSIDNEPVPEGYVDKLTPYKPGTEGTRPPTVTQQKLDLERTDDADMTLLGADQATQLILDPNLREATGPIYDVPMHLSTLGFPGYEDSQATQIRANNVSLEAATPQLEKMGVNPTDRDMQIAFGTVPTAGAQPEAWIDWYENTYMPALSVAILRGTRPDMHNAVMMAARSAVDKAKTIHAPQGEPYKEQIRQIREDLNLTGSGPTAAESGWTVRRVD